MDLYLIGNGFDLNENLNTKYDDFRRYLQENNSDLIDSLRQFYDSIFDDKEVENEIVNFDRNVLIKKAHTFCHLNDYLWGSLESNLANISYSSIIHEWGLYRFPIKNNKELIKTISNNYRQTLTNLNKELSNWILKIETNTLFKKQFRNFNNFISFNYTNTLENRYSVEEKSICYIHGNANKDNLVFGCSKEDVMNFNKFSFDHINSSSLAKELKRVLAKRFKCVNEIIEYKLQPFLDGKDFERIIVLGLSFSMVDLPYLNFIQKLFPKSNWVISFRDDSKKRIINFVNDHKLDFILIDDIDSFLSEETVDIF